MTRINESILKKLYKLKEYINDITQIQNSKFKTQNSNRNDFENTEICRLCFEPEDDIDGGLFLNPCKCIGSMKWIHKRCLLESIDILDSDICTICKYQYRTTQIQNSKLFKLLSEYKNTISVSLTYTILFSIILILRFIVFKNKRLINKTMTSIKLMSLFTISFHIIISIFKVFQKYIQTQTIHFEMNDIILIGGGYIFNAYDIWKHYIDIGLDKIKKFSKPDKVEYVNYTPISI